MTEGKRNPFSENVLDILSDLKECESTFECDLRLEGLRREKLKEICVLLGISIKDELDDRELVVEIIKSIKNLNSNKDI